MYMKLSALKSKIYNTCFVLACATDAGDQHHSAYYCEWLSVCPMVAVHFSDSPLADFNPVGQYNLYRSYRGAILTVLSQLHAL